MNGPLKSPPFFAIFSFAAIIAFVLQPTYSNADTAKSAKSAEQTDSTFLIDGRESEEIYINTAQGRFRLTAEIADTPQKSQKGLMFREQMPNDHGMLFRFAAPRVVLMWMKNTPMSLDMVFLSPKGEVVSIAYATTPYSEKVISSGSEAIGVLEFKAGIAKLLGIQAGDTLEHRYFPSK
ncbi:MAG: DUF192 domain-containing protein [Nitratireductor sp.]